MLKKKYISIIIIQFVIVLTLVLNINNQKKDLDNNSEIVKKSRDTISMMLETDTGSGNYELTTASSWPTEGYIFNTELSKCENGGELSWDDKNKVVFMAGNLSDKCYVYFDKMLEFYLDETKFQVRPDMTWGEWLESDLSDTWEHKKDIYTYDELVAMGISTDYSIISKGKEYTSQLFLTISDKFSNVSGSFSISPTSKIKAENCSTSAQTHVGICGMLGTIIRNETISLSLKKSVETSIPEAKYVPNLTDKEYNALIEEINNGKYYSKIESYICLSSDTLIDVEEIDKNGKKRRKRKKIKDIKIGDKIICINPATLELDTDTVVECDGNINKKHTCYDNWYFSDGTIITTVHRHRFYNIEKKKFVYMDEWNVGEHGLNINKEKIELIKHEHIEEEITHNTLFTEKYNNYFANGLLSGNRRSKIINYKNSNQ